MVLVNPVQSFSRPVAKSVMAGVNPMFGAWGSCSTKPGLSKRLPLFTLLSLMGMSIAGLFAQNHAIEQRDVQLRQQVEALSKRPTLDRMAQVIAKIKDATVTVYGGDLHRNGIISGGGVIFEDTKGKLYILSSGHVISDIATDAGYDPKLFDTNRIYHVQLYNGTDQQAPFEFTASLAVLSNGANAISKKEIHDMGLLEIPPEVKLPPNVHPIKMRDLAKNPLKLGEAVIETGNPFGARDSFSFGIVSNTDRSLSPEPQNRFVQTDAAMNPGNSGGGLVDMDAQLIGLNTIAYEGGSVGNALRVDVILSVLKAWGITPE
jgi:Trypsin-like peptidase domain